MCFSPSHPGFEDRHSRSFLTIEIASVVIYDKRKCYSVSGWHLNSHKTLSENESIKLQPGLLQEPDPGRDEGQQRRRRGRRRRRRPPGSQTQNDSELHQGAFIEIVEGQVL